MPSGHLWTLSGRLRAALAPPAPPPAVPWSTDLEDPAVGRVRLTGLLSGPPEAVCLLLLVHGLGGSVASPYLVAAASAAAGAGLATLRLDLRGADRAGEDYHHAGLTADLQAALASPELARFPHLLLAGFSLGGHLVLRYLTEEPEPRVRAGAAVCAPLDLAAGADAIDAPARWPYRRYLLNHLVEIYAAVAARRPVPVPVERARRVRRLREWDDLVVAPRFGFRDAADYYARASVGPLLGALRRPALLVAARRDPMVPAATLDAALARRPAALQVRWAERGGHVYFPAGLDLGLPGPRGLEGQLLGWLGANFG
ncbi:MAG: alpha/beta fold hydrolase [Thermoanaerobaculia bacterium]|nr:alpha/beta fold hydrolase [Thermoanaerobaculia bacterium]MCZ7650530.1 alpha/beta fold hydrolase [Thermoanaerobaculia bacterium]